MIKDNKDQLSEGSLSTNINKILFFVNSKEHHGYRANYRVVSKPIRHIGYSR
jgi:hypothetical protein